MRQYVPRLTVALLVVVPLMFVLVPLAHRVVVDTAGGQAGQSLWLDFQNMAGFYGGYALLAGASASLVHTWLISRFRIVGPASQVLWGLGIGILALIPQAAAFGQGYWMVNIATGAAAGTIYAVLGILLPNPSH